MERLPMRYRVVVWLTGVACFAGLGGWSAVSMTAAATAPAPLSGPVLPGAVLGALMGAVLGGLLVAAFVRALAAPDLGASTPSH